MLSILKRKGIKIAGVRALIAIAVAIAAVVISGFGFLKLIQGPIPLESIQSDEYSNQYVETVMDLSFGAFMELYSVEENTKKETLTNGYYIYPNQDNIFLGVMVPKDDLATVDQITDETYKWLDDSSITPTTTMKIKGTLTKMSEEENGYFVDALEYLGYSSDEIEKVSVPYMLKTDYIGHWGDTAVYGFTGIAIIALIYALFALLKAFSGYYQRNIKTYIKKNPEVIMEELEEDFNNAHFIDGKIWVGKMCTVFLKGPAARIVKNKNIVWAYYSEVSRTSKGVTTTERNIVLYDINKKKEEMKISSNTIGNQILQIYQDTLQEIVIGYNEALNDCFENDFNAFLTIPRQIREQEQAQA